MEDIISLVQKHAWIALAAILIGALVRASKSDTFPLWKRIPSFWRPIIVLALGQLSGVFDAVSHGTGWQNAAVGGLVSAALATFGHEFLIEGIRGGQEVGAPSAGAATLALCLWLTSCATARDVAVVAVNMSADFGREAEPILESLDKAEQQEALKQSNPKAALAAVRARYHKAWNAYRAYRAAWLAAASAVHAYDSADALGRSPDPASLIRFVGTLADAEKAFAEAAAAIGGAL